MQVEQHDEQGTIVLPDVVDLTNAPDFKKALQTLYDMECKTINVDCARLQMIDSAGLGSLVIYQKRLKERGGELRLINVHDDYIKHLFEMIDLQRVIQINY